ncbi:hypothetical protein RchiOBHm_Chr7g0197461 [Rosa chinensis]|uniref:Uncharacterized protein n=1 Tax=Rosa chinensis TaxID=74649 RepID=A0A2P6P6V6_ROSCH|nr:hypothetical protein RchiOBHm_Chr7g0197461 [Rosa chinensis]
MPLLASNVYNNCWGGRVRVLGDGSGKERNRRGKLTRCAYWLWSSLVITITSFCEGERFFLDIVNLNEGG